MIENETWNLFSEKEKQENIDYILNNARLEKVLKNFKSIQRNDEDFLEFLNAFIERNDNDA